MRSNTFGTTVPAQPLPQSITTRRRRGLRQRSISIAAYSSRIGLALHCAAPLSSSPRSISSRICWISAPNSGSAFFVSLKPLNSGGLWLPVTWTPPSSARATTA